MRIEAPPVPAPIVTASPATPGLSEPMRILFTVAVGILVANLFTAQPMLASIAQSFGVETQRASLAVVLTQIGYAAGLFLVLPLGDLFENRKLILRVLGIAVVAMLGVAASPTLPVFLVACFLLGFSSSVVQLIITMASLLTPAERRGAMLGGLMSGIMLGLLLARPIASVLSDVAGWRSIYVASALGTSLVWLVAARLVPRRAPVPENSYIGLLASLATLLREEETLRRRATYQALLMAAFGSFWTSIALLLAAPPFDLSAKAIALFALVGAAGAVAAPVAGRAGDRGWSRTGTVIAQSVAVVALVLAGIGGGAWGILDVHASPALAIALLVAAAVLLDIGAVGDQSLGRREVNLLRPAARGRMNGLFSGLFFVGSAIGAAASGFAWHHGGWSSVSSVALAFASAAWLLRAFGR
jgi:predicted MFS family arabinose efflux permease